MHSNYFQSIYSYLFTYLFIHLFIYFCFLVSMSVSLIKCQTNNYNNKSNFFVLVYAF